MSRLSRRVSRVLSLRRGPEVMPVRDLILMDEINEDNVVAVLRKRFTDDEIYVNVVLGVVQERVCSCLFLVCLTDVHRKCRGVSQPLQKPPDL